MRRFDIVLDTGRLMGDRYARNRWMGALYSLPTLKVSSAGVWSSAIADTRLLVSSVRLRCMTGH